MQNKHLSYTWNTHNKHFIIASQGIFPSITTLSLLEMYYEYFVVIRDVLLLVVIYMIHI